MSRPASETRAGPSRRSPPRALPATPALLLMALLMLPLLPLAAQAQQVPPAPAQEQAQTQTQSGEQSPEEPEKQSGEQPQAPAETQTAVASEPVDAAVPEDGVAVADAADAAVTDPPADAAARAATGAAADAAVPAPTASEQPAALQAPLEAPLPVPANAIDAARAAAEPEPPAAQAAVALAAAGDSDPSTDADTAAADSRASAAVGELASALSSDELLAQPPAAHGLLDRARLDAWLDGMVETAMLAQQLPGVVVAVVEADQLVSSRGWGLADIAEQQLADPQRSRFRVGSISKVVTATALMQLVEQGQVDLKQSAARYLDPLPYADGEAVTLIHLLTHQAGFEDAWLGQFYAIDAASDHELLPWLKRHPPARVRLAGELSSYSNYSYAVLGAVIAEVSRSPFEAHMDALLAEMGMLHSTYRERAGVPRADAMTAAEAAALAEGYRRSGWRQQAEERFWMHRGLAPAGSLSSTAEDMARFMRLHLNEGLIDGRRVLQAATLRQMHEVLTRHHPAVGGNAHGFWSRELSGLRTIEHAGAVLNFHSNLVLLPEAGVGIFVSTNGADGRQFVQDLPRQLVEQFLASREPAPHTAAADFAERAPRYSGVYRSTRRNYSSFAAAGNLLGGDSRIEADLEAGVLLLSGNGPLQAWRERSPGVFVSERDGSTLAFSSIADGPAARAWPAYGHVVLERVPWYARSELFYGLAGAVLLLSLLRVLGLRLRRPLHGGALEHSAAAVAWLAALGWIAFAVALQQLTASLSTPAPTALAHFPDAQAVWTLGIGLAAGALSLLSALLLPALLRRARWPWWRRLHYLLFVLAALALLPLLWYWRLLGWHFSGHGNPWWPPGL